MSDSSEARPDYRLASEPLETNDSCNATARSHEPGDREHATFQPGYIEPDESSLGADASNKSIRDSDDLAPRTVTRRSLVAMLASLGITSSVFARAVLAQEGDKNKLSAEIIRQAEWIADIELTDQQRARLASDLEKNRRDRERLRAVECDADVAPSCVFRPDFYSEPSATQRLADQRTVQSAASPIKQLPASLQRKAAASTKPESDIDLVYASLVDQAAWLQAGKVSSVELTKLYLDRLEKFDSELHCVVTLLRDTAMEEARAADERRAKQQSLGILDGIPWVAKDLMAVPPHKTTWGAEPYRHQVRPNISTVAKRLQTAGGVLLAKVSLGALAWGDVWFGGMTRNPWQTKQGSSGSSAGTASSVAAGLTTYGIGSETLGSIVSPCVRCSVSGLRPSYGRVSRYGCMPLAWSFDKLGPIARYVDDLAIIFSHMCGPDGHDPSVVDRPFYWPESRSIKDMKIGVTEKSLSAAEQQALDWLVEQGARRVPIKLPDRFPQSAMTVMLNVEATTVFDEILRREPDADLGLWPESFRKGQFTTAVQYLQASRLRSMLIQETETVLREVDVLFAADDLVLTNLTGHPSLVVALGTQQDKDQDARPATVKLTSAMYAESTLLHVGSALQRALPPTPSRPSAFL